MSVDITKVIAHSRKCRDIALNSVICLEENIPDLEGKLDLLNSEHVILDHITNKLQMYNVKIHHV